jgi:PAS domain S-box-containing protein
MKDQNKTEGKLIKEHATMQKNIAMSEKSESERVKAEEALRESEQYLKAIFNNSSDGIAVIDQKGIFIDFNKAFTDMLGYTSKDLEKLSYRDLTPEEYSDLDKKAVKQLLDRGFFDEYEKEFIRKGGTRITANITGAVIGDKQEGRNWRAFAFVKDITELKKAQNRAKLFSDAVQGSVDAMALSDLSGKLNYVNSTFEKMWGYSFKEATKMRIPEFVAEEELGKLTKVILPTIREKGGYVGETIGLKKDNTKFPISLSASLVKDEKGEPMAMLGSFMDITERKQIEEERKEIQERFSGLYNSSKDAIGWACLDGTLLDVNDAFSGLTGYSKEELLAGKKYQELTPEGYHEYESEKIESIMKTGKPDEYEKEYVRKDGSRVPVLLTVFVVKGAKGKTIGVAAIIKDITERKEMQEKLMRQEKLAVLGKLAGGMGHELRNPLGVISNSVYYLKMKFKDSDEKALKHLDILAREVERANKLITDLLDFSRVKPPSSKEGDVNSVMEDALANIEIPESISVKTLLDEIVPPIFMDLDQIQLAFQNIISNAIKAMPDGGKLEIKTGVKNKFVTIEFKDTGEGIAKENITKIFEPLFTTRAKGIGLGLAIVRGIIDRHKGSIEIKSKLGIGTTITVRLPFHQHKEGR